MEQQMDTTFRFRGFGIWGLGLMVWGFGGLRFRAKGLGGLGFRG